MQAFESGSATARVAVTGANPNTFMGGGYQLKAGTKSISGFDFYAANSTNATYSGLKVNIWVWDTVNTGTANAANPAFSNLLGSYSFTTSPMTVASGYYYSIKENLAAPLLLNDTVIGITYNFQGTQDGVNYSSVNGLTDVIALNDAPTVGAALFNGYFRNANAETNGNFTSSVRSLGGYSTQSLAVRIYGSDTLDNNVNNVPEPASFLLMGLGLALMVNMRRKAR
ncbi:hypothetical protein GCM10027277_21070 [Pseudoduganella ginsengisoli]